jgi:DNA mismatch repair protein MutL
VRDLFFNVPARRKFLRSEATESFHLTNLVTHYALAHPEIAFSLTNNGREVLRVTPANDLRERAYQIFGSEFLDNLLEVNGGHERIARVGGFISAPRDRRTSRDAQYLFVNGRFVRDRLIGRALSEGYRSILPHGVYPAALLFIDIPLEEVDVNVHPAKTEVRFRRAPAVADAVRDSVRTALASAGYVRAEAKDTQGVREPEADVKESGDQPAAMSAAASEVTNAASVGHQVHDQTPPASAEPANPFQSQSRIEFGWDQSDDHENLVSDGQDAAASKSDTARDLDAILRDAMQRSRTGPQSAVENQTPARSVVAGDLTEEKSVPPAVAGGLPPLNSAARFTREAAVETLSNNIRPLGQLDESFIIATDNDGLLLIDQHVAHERVLFDKYRALETTRLVESQHLLIPETFDLPPSWSAMVLN